MSRFALRARRVAMAHGARTKLVPLLRGRIAASTNKVEIRPVLSRPQWFSARRMLTAAAYVSASARAYALTLLPPEGVSSRIVQPRSISFSSVSTS